MVFLALPHRFDVRSQIVMAVLLVLDGLPTVFDAGLLAWRELDNSLGLVDVCR